jgi:ribonuclease VapC
VTLQRPARADLAIDTSAIMSMVLGEPSSRRVYDALARSEGPIVSAATVAELMMVAVGRRGASGAEDAQAILDLANVVTIPVDDQTVLIVHDAWARFGKGRHPAGLNYGDCFSYAVARQFEVPLLCIGNDFVRTDLQIVDTS